MERSGHSIPAAAEPHLDARQPARVIISGASGLIGGALAALLRAQGGAVRALVRRAVRDPAREVYWNPDAGQIEPSQFEGVHAVVHLSGENIAGGRWTPHFKQRLRRSRVDSTRLLAETLARLARPPEALLCASAVGYYGDRGDEELTETSPPGAGFLAELARDWESAAAAARERGIRVVHLRLGVVLAAHGGVLGQLLTPFRRGLGGVIGSGRQYMSWISLHDAVRAISFLLQAERLAGPVNVVSPRPVANREFTRALGRALGRPTLLGVPSWAVRLGFGEMGESLLLGSCRALPARLQEAGFVFQSAELEAALRRELGLA